MIKLFMINNYDKKMTANYITIDNDFNFTKRRNFFSFELMSNFVWMFFHFTVVFFFMIRLESLMLV